MVAVALVDWMLLKWILDIFTLYKPESSCSVQGAVEGSSGQGHELSSLINYVKF
jgi:hypothetical protein